VKKMSRAREEKVNEGREARKYWNMIVSNNHSNILKRRGSGKEKCCLSRIYDNWGRVRSGAPVDVKDRENWHCCLVRYKKNRKSGVKGKMISNPRGPPWNVRGHVVQISAGHRGG